MDIVRHLCRGCVPRSSCGGVRHTDQHARKLVPVLLVQLLRGNSGNIAGRDFFSFFRSVLDVKFLPCLPLTAFYCCASLLHCSCFCVVVVVVVVAVAVVVVVAVAVAVAAAAVVAVVVIVSLLALLVVLLLVVLLLLLWLWLWLRWW